MRAPNARHLMRQNQGMDCILLNTTIVIDTVVTPTILTCNLSFTESKYTYKHLTSSWGGRVVQSQQCSRQYDFATNTRILQPKNIYSQSAPKRVFNLACRKYKKKNIYFHTFCIEQYILLCGSFSLSNYIFFGQIL